MKKRRIRKDLDYLVESQPRDEYITMSKQLLETHNPENILAALLQYSFQDELNEQSYTEIADRVVDTKGKTRLFVTQGKKDNLTRKKLAAFIQNKCGISADQIRDIQILDKFSFVTLPFHEAELLLSHFKKRKKGSGPFISKAKNKKGRK